MKVNLHAQHNTYCTGKKSYLSDLNSEIGMGCVSGEMKNYFKFCSVSVQDFLCNLV